jgi:mRNA-degrading endonuclease RelE of RelBE toxin-antitoxin system
MARRRRVLRGRAEGLGIEFIQAVRNAIEIILQSPRRWPVFSARSRAYRLNEFPYRLVYSILTENEEVLIASVMHTSRDAAYLSKWLGDAS